MLPVCLILQRLYNDSRLLPVHYIILLFFTVELFPFDKTLHII